MIKIGDFSKLSRISIRMLRHYAETGLLAPEKIDPFTGYRYYSEAQLPIANRITALKDMGFGLAAIGEILAQNPELYTFFSVHTYILTPYAASRTHWFQCSLRSPSPTRKENGRFGEWGAGAVPPPSGGPVERRFPDRPAGW